MLRKLLFPSLALVALVAISLSTPQPATAYLCDHQDCDAFSLSCTPQLYWNCFGAGGDEECTGEQVC